MSPRPTATERGARITGRAAIIAAVIGAGAVIVVALQGGDEVQPGVTIRQGGSRNVNIAQSPGTRVNIGLNESEQLVLMDPEERAAQHGSPPFGTLQEMIEAWEAASGREVDHGALRTPTLFQQFFETGQIVVDETEGYACVLARSDGAPVAFRAKRSQRVLSSYTPDHLVVNQALVDEALQNVEDPSRHRIYRHLLEEERHDRKGIRGGIADVYISGDLFPLLGYPRDRETAPTPSALLETPEALYPIGVSVDPGNYELSQPMRAVLGVEKPIGSDVPTGSPWRRSTIRK